MRRMWLAALLFGCNDAGFQGVAIRPTYGWADGCTDVLITGRGFDDGVTATVGGSAVTGITLPDPEVEPLDVGFEFHALTPPGTPGFANMMITNGDGQFSEVTNAFYYVTCPAAPHVDGMSPTEAAPNDTVSIAGCGFQEGLQAQLVSLADPTAAVASAPLTLACSTAVVGFTVPAVADGTYLVLIADGSGTVVYGGNLCDTADTGGGCEAPLYLTVGGAT
jgi:hypothetical protein